MNICSIDFCGLPVVARKMCRRHYNAWYWHQKKEGGTTALPRPAGESTEYLLSLMDPEWLVPEWNIKQGNLPGPRQITARKRLQSFASSVPMTKTALAKLVGYANSTCVAPLLTNYYYFPSLDSANRIHAVLDEYERSHPKP